MIHKKTMRPNTRTLPKVCQRTVPGKRANLDNPLDFNYSANYAIYPCKVSNRIPTKAITDAPDWVAYTVDLVLERFPEEPLYTCAAGISPSGVVHFGNLRDIMTNLPIVEELKRRGKKARLLFSWDDFDRFRKVPKGMPEHLNLPISEAILKLAKDKALLDKYLGTGVNDLPEDLKEEARNLGEEWFQQEYKQYEGMPLTQVPDPLGEFGSYAHRLKQEFEVAMEGLGIEIDYRNQSEMYQSGAYLEGIVKALQNRKQIAEILFSFMSEPAISQKGIVKETFVETFSPVSVYSSFTGKDATEILEYDGHYGLRYRCKISGNEEVLDLREAKNVKLQWKIDWPMRWAHEKVHFEPGGKDHATPGGSYDVSFLLAEKIYDISGPVFVGYDFIGISGLAGKMSSSAGNAVSPSQLLEIYTPELLKWIYSRTKPNRPFNLSFGSDIYRQYSEFDETFGHTEAIPFRQLVGYGQIVNWDKEKLRQLLEKLGEHYSEVSIEERLPRAKAWLETYNRSELVELTESPRSEFYRSLPEELKHMLNELATYLEVKGTEDLEAMNATLYQIPKADKAAIEPSKEDQKRQKEFFRTIYQLLFSQDRGPRLATYFWAVGPKILLDRIKA